MRKQNQTRVNLALVLALSRAYQIFIRHMNPQFKRARLTASQWDVMETLTSKGPMSVGELMASLLSTSGNIDVVIRNLIVSGYVEKVPNKTDRRGRIVSLTESGKQKANAFYPVHNNLLAELFEGLTQQEKRALIKALNNFRKKVLTPKESNDHDKHSTTHYSCSHL